MRFFSLVLLLAISLFYCPSFVFSAEDENELAVVDTTTGSPDETTDASPEPLTEKPVCEDNPDAECETMEKLCSNTLYHDVLEKNCPKTCHFCEEEIGTTETPCVDDSESCETWALKGFCQNDFYKNAWDMCRKTCGLCQTSNECEDNSTYCADWDAKGFCKNSAYKDVWEEFCKKTCGYCK